MGYLMIALLIGLIPAAIAKGKGYNFFLWWFYGAMLFIVALPFAIVMKPKAAVETTSGLRKCPKCAELIQPEAIKCKHCGSDVAPLSADEQKVQTTLAQQQVKKANYVPGWIVALALIFVIGLIVVAAENNGNDDSSNATASTAPTTTPAEPARAPALKVGDTFNLGDVQITILSVKIASRLGAEFMQSTAAKGGEYVAVKWEYKNISGKPISAFDKPALILIDPNGNAYDSDIAGSASYASEVGEDEKVLSDLNPGITVTSADAFEVGKTAFDKNRWFISIKGNDNARISMAAN